MSLSLRELESDFIRWSVRARCDAPPSTGACERRAQEDTTTFTTMTTEMKLSDFVFSDSSPNKDERLKFVPVYELMLVVATRIDLFAYILII